LHFNFHFRALVAEVIVMLHLAAVSLHRFRVEGLGLRVEGSEFRV
jgi:hypothetical protein